MSDVEYLMQSVIRGITEILITEKGMSLQESLETLRASRALALLMDEQTGLYRESAGYVYEFLKDELDG